MQKKSFILLELLIAFALVSLSVLPFIHFPYSHIQQEIKTLFLTELENKTDEALAEMYLALRHVSSNHFLMKETHSPSSRDIPLRLLSSFFKKEETETPLGKKHPWDESFFSFSLPGSNAKKHLLMKRSVFLKKKEETAEGRSLVFLVLRVSFYEKKGSQNRKWKRLHSADLKVTCQEPLPI